MEKRTKEQQTKGTIIRDDDVVKIIRDDLRCEEDDERGDLLNIYYNNPKFCCQLWVSHYYMNWDNDEDPFCQYIILGNGSFAENLIVPKDKDIRSSLQVYKSFIDEILPLLEKIVDDYRTQQFDIKIHDGKRLRFEGDVTCTENVRDRRRIRKAIVLEPLKYNGCLIANYCKLHMNKKLLEIEKELNEAKRRIRFEARIKLFKSGKHGEPIADGKMIISPKLSEYHHYNNDTVFKLTNISKVKILKISLGNRRSGGPYIS